MSQATTISQNCLQAIMRLGFTNLEAEVYAFLARDEASTGYRIAQALGKPVGNIYKAIEVLEAKGAVLTSEEDENRVVAAVPPAELLARIEQEFQDHRRTIETELVSVAADALDDRLYRLHTPEQVHERARSMIGRAKSFVLGTLCPAPFLHHEAHLADTLARGVRVGIKVFDGAELPGARIVHDSRGAAAIDSGPGQWMFLTADGGEYLMALFTHDGCSLHQAFWSANAFLVWTLFTGMSSDLVLAEIKSKLCAPTGSSPIRELIDEFSPFETPRSAGKVTLLRRYRGPARPTRRQQNKANSP